jgi:hypothetical protein
MQLRDAARRAKKLVDDGVVKGQDAAALTSLVELARRVDRVGSAIASLHRAVNGDDHLNQRPLFDFDGG